MVRIQNGISVKHPFFLCYVIIAQSSCKFVQTLKQSPMNEYQIVRREREGFFGQYFSDSCGHLISFLSPLILYVFPDCLRLIVAVNQMPYLTNGYISFDVSARCLQQILRRFKAINVLQTDCSLPCLSLPEPFLCSQVLLALYICRNHSFCFI